MPAEDVSPRRVAQWVEKAEQDLTAAASLLRLRAERPLEVVCFHAQQCVEKYIKAVLFAQQRAFPKTHDLVKLIALLPKDCQPSLSAELQERLTDYATTVRYPVDEEPVSPKEARTAVAAARRVRKDMRRLLPRAALGRRRK